MDRREFVQFSVAGAAGLALPLWACGDGGVAAIDVRVTEGYLVQGPDGRHYVLEPHGHRISVQTTGGHELGVIGSRGAGAGELNYPLALDFDGAGRLFVADHGNSRVQVFGADGVHRYPIGSWGSGDGELAYPADLVVDGDRILVADTLNHRIQVFATDGTPLARFGAGELNGPRAVALDDTGRVHVVDGGNRRVAVFDPGGRLERSYADRGSGRGGVEHPRAIVIDGTGHSYVADVSTTSVLRYDPSGALAGSLELTLDDGRPASPVHLGLSRDQSLLVTAVPGFGG